MYRLTLSSLFAILLSLSVVVPSFSAYQLGQLSTSEWEGTRSDCLQSETSGVYQFDYGDTAAVSFNLP